MERARRREGKRSRKDTGQREREEMEGGARERERKREEGNARTKVSIVTPARLCALSLSLSLLLSFSVPHWFFSSFVAIHGWTSPTSLSFYAGSRHYARTAVCGNGWRDPRRGILKVLGWLPHFQNSSFRFRPKERFYSTVVAWDAKVLETISFCLARIIKNEGAADTSEFSFP